MEVERDPRSCGRCGTNSVALMQMWDIPTQSRARCRIPSRVICNGRLVRAFRASRTVFGFCASRRIKEERQKDDHDGIWLLVDPEKDIRIRGLRYKTL